MKKHKNLESRYVESLKSNKVEKIDKKAANFLLTVLQKTEEEN